MSSIWTPSGEHSLPDDDPRADAGPGPEYGEPSVSPEEVAAIRQIQGQIRSTPAIDIVANHVVQLFELALVYLGVTSPPDEHGNMPYPDLAQAGVAIDAMQLLVDGMGARWSEHEQTLRDGLSQIQMLYVQIADQLGDSPTA